MELHKIEAPRSGDLSYTVNQNQVIELDFDVSGAVFERDGNDLTIAFDAGGSVRLEGFFVLADDSGSTELPRLQLADGTQVETADFLLSLNPDLDVSTAAGPDQGSSGSGLGEYSSDPGSLVGGVDRLGTTDPFRWSAAQEARVEETGNGLAAAPETPGNPAPGNPDPGRPDPGNPDPGNPDMPYHTRLIVTDTGRNSFSFHAVDADGNLVFDASLLSASFKNGSEYFIITGIDPLTGKISVELTQAGLDALAAGRYAGDLLTVGIGGKEYNMPLIINEQQSYDYISEEARAELGPDLKAEWYASDSSTVSGENITLGGSGYNRVDIDSHNPGTNFGSSDTHIDVRASSKSDVYVSAEGSGTNRGFATSSGSSSSILGGAESNIDISGKSGGQGTYAYGVDSRGQTTIDGNKVSIGAANTNSGGALGVYGTGAGSLTDIHAGSSLEISSFSAESDKDSPTMVSGVMADYSAAVNLRVDSGGKLLVESRLASTDQHTGSMENSGTFKVTGISARAGGQISAQASDIKVSAEVDDTSTNGTAVAVYSGWTEGATRSNVNLKGYDGVENKVDLSAKAKDVAIGILGTNSGNVTVQGGDRNDNVSIAAEAGRGSAIGVAAQAHNNQGGSKVYLDGGDGEDSLNISARFTGTAYSGNLENFEAPRGAIGVAAAWSQSWGNDDYSAAQVRIDNFEKVDIKADATGSTGSAIGIFTRSASPTAPGVYIDSHGKALDLTVTAKADDSSKAHSIYNFGGTVDIKGGSSTGTSDSIKLTGHMTATGPGAGNYITTGSGNDLVSLNGDMNAAWGKNSISTGEGDDQVKVTGSLKAGSGSNTINAGNGDNSVEIGWSMIAQGNSSNSVTSGSGRDSVSVTGQMYASGGGKNTIDTGLNEPGKGFDAVNVKYGTVASGNGSQNHITSDVVRVTNLNGTAVYTSADQGSSAETHITARQNLLIDGSNANGSAYGVFSQGDSSTRNVIKAGTGIEINAATSGSGDALGVYANWSSTAQIETAQGDIAITADSAQGQAWGVNGNNNVSLKATGQGGKITMDVDAETNAMGIWGGTYQADQMVDVDVDSRLGTAEGVVSMGRSNTSISAAKVVIDARSELGTHPSATHEYGDETRAMGVYTFDDSSTSVTASEIEIRAEAAGAGNAIGLRVDRPNSTDMVTSTTLTGDKVSVAATAANGDAFGLHATGNHYTSAGHAANIIKAGAAGAEITAQSAQGAAAGLFASRIGALNSVESEGNITVKADGGDGGMPWQSRGLDAVNSGENVLKAGREVTINSSASSSAIGLYAGGREYAYAEQASNTVTAAGDITVNTASQGGSAWGVHNDDGLNTLNSANGNVTITSTGVSGDVRGMVSSGGGKNTVEAANGEVKISAIGGAFGRGIDAWGGDNIITAASVSITNLNSRDAVGVAASSNGRNQIDSSGNITITAGRPEAIDNAATAHDWASGLWAYTGGVNQLRADGAIDITAQYGRNTNALRNEGGANELTADSVALKAVGGTEHTYGMYADNGGNTVSANQVSVTADSGTGVVAMQALNGGVNLIQGLGEGVTVVIKGTGMDNAIAMWADGNGSVNHIKGNLGAAHSDSISIEGSIYATNGGRNLIETGGGDDTISLKGYVQSGSLNILAGDGHDTLILHAASVSEFNQFYKGWLESYTGGTGGMSIEEVRIELSAGEGGNLGDLSQLTWLGSHFADSNLIISGSAGDDFVSLNVSDFSDITFHGNGGSDAMTIRFDDGGGDAATFGQFMGKSQISGLNSLVLDLTEGDHNLSLDGLFDKLDGATENLFIKGDAGDSINLGLDSGTWDTAGTEMHDGVEYHAYTNQELDMTIYVQTSMGIL